MKIAGETVKKRTITNTFETKNCSGCTDDDINYDEMLVRYCSGMLSVYDSVNQLDSTNVKASTFTQSLAKLFKEMAWEYTDSSWKASKVSVEGALLYAILLAQSIIFFIAYLKRLFYIIILIVMAPIVVVYDFFNKFAS